MNTRLGAKVMNEVWQNQIPPQDIEAEQAVLGAIF